LEDPVAAMQRSGLFHSLLLDGSFASPTPAQATSILVAVLRPAVCTPRFSN
jgi:hypothetical protein